jgi:uncharacterized membrane protein
MSPHDEEVIRSNDATIKDMEVCTFFFLSSNQFMNTSKQPENGVMLVASVAFLVKKHPSFILGLFTTNLTSVVVEVGSHVQWV